MALKKKEKQFKFLENLINLNKNCGLFVTFNPKYAGRTELPDSLKVLFRPMPMMIPDFELIAEILFLSDGKII